MKHRLLHGLVILSLSLCLLSGAVTIYAQFASHQWWWRGPYRQDANCLDWSLRPVPGWCYDRWSAWLARDGWVLTSARHMDIDNQEVPAQPPSAEAMYGQKPAHVAVHRLRSPNWSAPVWLCWLGDFGWGLAESSAVVNEMTHVTGFAVVGSFVCIPHGVIVVATGIAPALQFGSWWRTRRRLRAGHCVHCGYDLHGSHGACPECGAAAASPSK